MSIDDMSEEELVCWASWRIAMAPVLDEMFVGTLEIHLPTEDDRYRSEYERIFGHK